MTVRWMAGPAAALLLAGPATADAYQVLVFTRTLGYRHDSIPDAIAALRAIGAREGFAVEATEEPASFESRRLARYRVVVFLLTTGDVLGPAQERALEDFIRAGGGFVGVHSACDTEYDWDWYVRLVGWRLTGSCGI